MATQPNIYSFDQMRRRADAADAPAQPRPRPSQQRYIPSRSDVYAFDDLKALELGSGNHYRSSRPTTSARDEGQGPDEGAQDIRGRSAGARRSRTKHKADRAYERQYGRAERAAAERAAGQAAPRAAVYKGRMGTKQRQASRMQEHEARDAAQPSRRRARPRLVGCLAVVACLAIACAFLYTPAQNYYQALREQDQLEAELEALEERNAELESQVEYLETDAGIEQAAHEQLGWVSEGETAGSVEGLEEDEEDADAQITVYIASGSVEAPDTWYTPFLDALFGVD